MAIEKEEGATHLTKSHRHSTIVSASRQTACRSGSHSSCNAGLWWTVGFVTASTEQACNTSGTRCTTGTAACTTSQKATEELTLLTRLLDVVFYTNASRGTLVGRWCSSLAHESANHDCSIDYAVALCTTERRGLAARDFTVFNDSGVCLRTAAAELCVSLRGDSQI
jgi:hypothetical protein